MPQANRKQTNNTRYRQLAIVLALIAFSVVSRVYGQQGPLTVTLDGQAGKGVAPRKAVPPIEKRVVGRPSLRFQSRHAKIGEPIYVSLALKHLPELDLVFPDSLTDYAPFEFLNKTFYPTKTEDGYSVDSVVYTLQTFQMKPEQQLVLAIVDLTGGDTALYVSNADTLYLHRLLPEVPTRPVLKAVTEAEVIPPRINYNYWALGLGVAIIAILLINAFLGKPIQKGFNLLVLYRRHVVFTTLFDRLANQTLRNRSTDTMEQALNLWKQYMERVDNRPFSTYTTKEIKAILPDDNLAEVLTSIDRAVYGGIKDEISERIFTVLRRYSLVFYNKRKEVINTGLIGKSAEHAPTSN